jgi:hypothetical protein
MKRILLVVAIAAAFPAAAEPLSDPQRARATAIQAEQQRRIDQARERCIANRGPDCDSLPGLQEWLLQDRSRSDAVLDRLGGGESASTGSSAAPVRPDLPAISPRQQ